MGISRLRNRFSVLDLLAVGALVVLFILYIYNLTGWMIFDDEGEYLYQVWQMGSGAVPYRDFLTPQLPVFLYSGTAIMVLGGGELWVMRLFSVVLAFGTAFSLLLYGRKHHHLITGFLAAVLFLLHSDVFKETRIFRNEPLFIFFMTVGLVVATWNSHKRRHIHLIVAGILFGLGTLVKLFGLLPAAGVVAWLAWDTLRYKRQARSLIRAVLQLVVPLFLVVAGTYLLFSLIAPEFLDLVLGHHLEQGSDKSLLSVLTDKADLYLSYIRFNPIFVLLAVVSGFWGLVSGDKRERWFWQIPTVLGFLFLSRELGQRHFMYLLPTLALFVGWILASGFIGDFRWWGRAVSVIILVLIIIPWIPLNLDRAKWHDKDTERVVAAINEHSSEGAAILSDDIGLAFYSERPTTYSGAALSHGAVTSGQITGEILISEIIKDGVEVVIVDESLLTGNHLVFLRDYPRFHRFLENNFSAVEEIRRDYQELTVWSREEDEQWIIEDRLEIEHEISDAPWFGDTIRLIGFSAANDEITPGEFFDFSLFWQSNGPADNYWSVFTHLISPDGNLVVQHDKVPYEGLYPPDRWWPGQIIDDNYQMMIPEDIPLGEYQIIIGMYDHLTGDRLQLRSASGLALADDQYKLPVTIPSKNN